jgi:hypothetical protein
LLESVPVGVTTWTVQDADRQWVTPVENQNNRKSNRRITLWLIFLLHHEWPLSDKGPKGREPAAADYAVAGVGGALRGMPPRTGR